MLDFNRGRERFPLMQQYARVAGVLVEPFEHLWAAYSPATGETALLNDESAAILEVLESGASDTSFMCSTLATDSGLEAASLVDTVETCWPRMIEAGLVRKLHPDHAAER